MRCRAKRLAVRQMVSAGNTVSPEHGGNAQILASQVLSEQSSAESCHLGVSFLDAAKVLCPGILTIRVDWPARDLEERLDRCSSLLALPGHTVSRDLDSVCTLAPDPGLQSQPGSYLN